jgi:hypothetical protein
MRKVELKMKYLEQLDTGLVRDREHVERARQALVVERLALHRAGAGGVSGVGVVGVAIGGSVGALAAAAGSAAPALLPVAR